MEYLKEGDAAPKFTATDQNGKEVSDADFRGTKTILYFYPKDNTSGCTKEACSFRDNMPDFKKLDAVIIGVSPDSQKSHQKFRDKYELTFTLLSDEDKTVLEKYGVWQEKKMYGKTYMGVVRTTYVIDENGKIMKVFPKVKVDGHTEEVLKVIEGK